MDIRIDGVDAMAHGEARTFEFPRNGRSAQGFLIRYHDGYHAYLNQCQHWPVPLDLGDGDFFYDKADRIVCKTHGAAYKADTGECDSGPCVRASLDAYPVALKDGNAVVTVPD